MVLALGSTSYLTVLEIAKRIKEENLEIKAVPTSKEIEELCETNNIPTINLLEAKIDWSFDGADEYDSENRLIKGKGRALFKEKLNMVSSPITYILVDHTKYAENLGEKTYVPVEIYPTALNYVSQKLEMLGAKDIIFKGMTENENSLVEVKFDFIENNLEEKIKVIPRSN